MPENLRLVGRRIVEVRPMTAEEKERENWPEDVNLNCAVLDNGSILYAGSADGTEPGLALVQSGGVLWSVAAEGAIEVPPQHRRPPPPPSNAEKATTALAVLFTLSALLMVGVSLYDGVEIHSISLFGAGAMGQAAAAACLWLLRSFVRAGSQ